MIKHIIASMIIFFSLSYTMEEDEAKRAVSQMKTSKDRSCLNQLFLAFTQFCQASGQESLYRNGYAQTLPTNILREIAHNPILVKENVLCYQTMTDYDLEQLINFSRILCIRRPGLYFLTNNADQFAAAISGNAKKYPYAYANNH